MTYGQLTWQHVHVRAVLYSLLKLICAIVTCLYIPSSCTTLWYVHDVPVKNQCFFCSVAWLIVVVSVK